MAGCCASVRTCAKAKARGACIVVFDVTTVIIPRLTKTAMCEPHERGWYAVQHSRIASSPGTDLEPLVH
jgi:hypothetical protein